MDVILRGGSGPRGVGGVLARLKPAIVAVLFVLAALPASAQAHAVLEGTTPAAGAGLARAPAAVTARFNEPVGAPSGALRVIDSRGRSIQQGATFHPGGVGKVIAVRLPRSLPKGTYTATYLVVSADSHPVSGGFTFGIGAAPATGQGSFGASVAALVRARTAGPVTATAFSVVRAVQYAAIAVAGGALAFLVACWLPGLAEAAGSDPRWAASSQVFARRTRWLLVGAGVAGTISAVFAILLEGAQTRGVTLWGAASANVLADVFDTRFGTVWQIALVCWLFIAISGLARPTTVPVLRPASVGATGLALAVREAPLVQLAIPLAALCLLPSLAGHTSVDPPVVVMLPSNVLHVAAMAVWLGGIVMLVVALRAALGPLETADRTRLLAAVVSRFSVIAGATFAVLLASGVLQTVLELPSVSALVDTGYGRAILIKIILFAALVALGWLNRSRSLPGLRAAGESPVLASRLLRRTLQVELGLGVAVIAVTGALAGYDPRPAALPGALGAATGGPVTRQAIAGPARLRATLPSTRTGQQRIALALTDRRTGAPFRGAKEVTATAALPGKNIPSLPLTLRRTGVGRYVASGALPVAGDWRVSVDVRVSEFDEYTARFTVPIVR